MRSTYSKNMSILNEKIDTYQSNIADKCRKLCNFSTCFYPSCIHTYSKAVKKLHRFASQDVATSVLPPQLCLFESEWAFGFAEPQTTAAQ